MDIYFWALTGGLCLAIALNLISASIKGLTLAYTVLFFLVILSPNLPMRSNLGAWWYILLIGLEVTLMQIAFLIKGDASNPVALCSFYNLLCHFTAMIAYNSGHDPESWHRSMLRVGEIAQVLSLVLFTKPVARYLILSIKRQKKEHTDGYQLVATAYR
jgi:hypothetical protein